MFIRFWHGFRSTFSKPQKQPSHRLALLGLESRLVPTLNPTGAEQEMLEMLNNMRTDPQGHFSKLISSVSPLTSTASNVTQALNYFGVSGSLLQSQWSSLTAVQPLAWNESLMTSSSNHNDQMIAQDTQSHQLPGEQSLGNRITAAGYNGWTNLGENIYAYADDAFYAHAGFAIDWGGSSATGGMQSPAGHRANMMSSAYREVGITVTAENNSATSVGPNVVTQDFGTRSGLSGGGYLLGVVYKDLNANSFYNAGEGLGNVSIQITGANGFNRTISSMTAGGYQTFLNSGTYNVTFSGGGLASTVTRTITIGTANVKSDVLASSGSSNTSSSNSAPVLNTTPVKTLSPVATGNSNPTGTTVGSLVNGVVTDANSGDSIGIAITGVTGSTGGSWQYSSDNGGSWNDIGAPSTSAARLLGPSDLIRFVPNAGFVGSASVNYKAWDGTSGTDGATANATTGGGTTAFSTAIESASVRVQTAPSLDSTKLGTFPVINEDTTNPAGVTISRLLGTAYSDPNSNTVTGVAITSLSNSSNGIWQYKLSGTTVWKNMGTVSTSSALLLRGADLVRFVPNANFNGTVSLDFKAWDRTQGSLAGRWDVSSAGNVGGGTAFSSQSVSVTQSIISINDAPVLNTATKMAMPAVGAAIGSTSQTTVGNLLGSLISDADSGASQGIAVIDVTRSSSYVWEYSVDGGTNWISLSSASPTTARLLRSSDLIRVRTLTAITTPIAARLAFRAWDQTSGTAGGTAIAAGSTYVGGKSAFSLYSSAVTAAIG